MFGALAIASIHNKNGGKDNPCPLKISLKHSDNFPKIYLLCGTMYAHNLEVILTIAKAFLFHRLNRWFFYAKATNNKKVIELKSMTFFIKYILTSLSYSFVQHL